MPLNARSGEIKLSKSSFESMQAKISVSFCGGCFGAMVLGRWAKINP